MYIDLNKLDKHYMTISDEGDQVLLFKQDRTADEVLTLARSATDGRVSFDKDEIVAAIRSRFEGDQLEDRLEQVEAGEIVGIILRPMTLAELDEHVRQMNIRQFGDPTPVR